MAHLCCEVHNPFGRVGEAALLAKVGHLRECGFKVLHCCIACSELEVSGGQSATGVQGLARLSYLNKRVHLGLRHCSTSTTK